jgi:hypothetical protein
VANSKRLCTSNVGTGEPSGRSTPLGLTQTESSPAAVAPPMSHRRLSPTNTDDGGEQVEDASPNPNEESALKIVYMAIREASAKWTMPIFHWKQALNHFAILFEGRMPQLNCK